MGLDEESLINRQFIILSQTKGFPNKYMKKKMELAINRGKKIKKEMTFNKRLKTKIIFDLLQT